MIKAGELRIGNWVSNGEKNYTVDVNMLYDLVTTEDYPIEPIRITENMLAKIGFKNDLVYRWRYSIGTFVLARTIIDWSAPPKKTNMCWSLALDYGNELRTQTEYLHQLQNLYFAITGEELEINL